MSRLSTAGHLPVSVIVCVWEEWSMAVRKLPTRIFCRNKPDPLIRLRGKRAETD